MADADEPRPSAPMEALRALLRLAREEGALEGERLEAFAAGLLARAELLLEERVARAEARVLSLEQELAASTDAHDRLLAHHKDVLARTADELAAVSALPLHRVAHVRRRIAALAATLRGAPK